MSHKSCSRRAATIVAIVVAINLGMASSAFADNAAALNTSGTANQTTNLMNQAAAFTAQQRMGTINSLYNAPMTTKLQSMTCLQQIMNIRFDGLSSFSFSSFFDSVTQAAIQALMQAACSYVDTAWNSAKSELTTMSTVELGSAGSASVGVGGDGAIGLNTGGVTTPYGSSTIQSGFNNNGSTSPYGGFGSTISDTASNAWEATKNFFK